MAEMFFTTRHGQGEAQLALQGAWTVMSAEALSEALAAWQPPQVSRVQIMAAGLEKLDTAGAWLLHRLCSRLLATGHTVEISGMLPEQETIYRLVADAKVGEEPKPRHPPLLRAFLERIGCGAMGAVKEAKLVLAFVGICCVTLVRSVLRPSRIRFSSISRHIDEAGIDAIPIVGLIAFLISIVLAYQGATQLQQFGAEIFTVDLVAISVMREMGVLLTAIMVAGRSGSAFTAEIGVMKVNEEVDAMRTLGLSPYEILVIPRIIALIIVLPLLTFIADMMGLLGAGVVSVVLLDLSVTQYVDRVKDVLDLTTCAVGMIKAPFFAFLIAIVGCHRGMEVSGSAESVGKLTTQSVVEAIFLVILADALFSIMFTQIGW